MPWSFELPDSASILDSTSGVSVALTDVTTFIVVEGGIYVEERVFTIALLTHNTALSYLILIILFVIVVRSLAHELVIIVIVIVAVVVTWRFSRVPHSVRIVDLGLVRLD